MNKFSVLDDSDDDETTPVVPLVKEKKAKKTPAVVEPAPVAPPVVVAEKPNAKKGKDTTKEQNGKSKNTDSSIESSKPTNAPPKQSSKPVEKPTAEGDDDVEAHKDNNRGGHSRGKDSHQRSTRTAKPGRGGEGGEGDETSRRPPKREFDRRSASGRGKEVHRGGRGPFGMGSVKQDALDAEKDPLSAEPEIEAVDEAVSPEVPEADAAEPAAAWTAEASWTAEEAAPEPEKEPEPVVFSLDEYAERQKDARSSLLAKVESRPERVVSAVGLVTVVKEELEDDKGVKGNSQKDKERKQQQLLDVSFKFQAPATDRDPRDSRKDGRGPGRGGRGVGGGGRGAPGRGRAPGAGRGSGGFSATDFPAL